MGHILRETTDGDRVDGIWFVSAHVSDGCAMGTNTSSPFLVCNSTMVGFKWVISSLYWGNSLWWQFSSFSMHVCPLFACTCRVAVSSTYASFRADLTSDRPHQYKCCSAVLLQHRVRSHRHNHWTVPSIWANRRCSSMPWYTSKSS